MATQRIDRRWSHLIRASSRGPRPVATAWSGALQRGRGRVIAGWRRRDGAINRTRVVTLAIESPKSWAHPANWSAPASARKRYASSRIQSEIRKVRREGERRRPVPPEAPIRAIRSRHLRPGRAPYSRTLLALWRHPLWPHVSSHRRRVGSSNRLAASAVVSGRRPRCRTYPAVVLGLACPTCRATSARSRPSSA